MLGIDRNAIVYGFLSLADRRHKNLNVANLEEFMREVYLNREMIVQFVDSGVMKSRKIKLSLRVSATEVRQNYNNTNKEIFYNHFNNKKFTIGRNQFSDGDSNPSGR